MSNTQKIDTMRYRLKFTQPVNHRAMEQSIARILMFARLFLFPALEREGAHQFFPHPLSLQLVLWV